MRERLSGMPKKSRHDIGRKAKRGGIAAAASKADSTVTGESQPRRA
jgi:hypothetical protein